MAREAQRIGRYELVTALAAGGMGKIWLGRLRGLGGFERHVVVKTLELGADEAQAKAMFLDEARVLGLLHHQHIAPVFEVGEDHGQLYLVIDYVHGRTAHEAWERTRQLGAALPIDFTLTVVAAAASGLHYAHTRTDGNGSPLLIVHRDVSPSNLMIGFDGAVKLIDFGIAKALNRTAITQSGFVKGKLGYMAPEQVRRGDIDARTDVFALGIVLYELTTMQRCFRDESDRVTLERIKSGTYVKPSELVAEYPRELERVIARALRLDPMERYQSAEEMRRAIDTLGHRYDLVLGDGAVTQVMHYLFDERSEPWQRAGSRASDLDLPYVPEPPDDSTTPMPSLVTPGKKFRSATELVYQLENELAGGPRVDVDSALGPDLPAFRPRMPTPTPFPTAPEEEADPWDPVSRRQSIQRLFTESSLADPTATPMRPIDTPVLKVRTPDEAPRRGTHRGVGVSDTTDGIEILPPAAVPQPQPRRGGSGKRILIIAITSIVSGALAILIYSLATRDGDDAPAIDAGTVVHAPPPIDAVALAIDATAIDASEIDAASGSGSDSTAPDAGPTAVDASPSVDAATQIKIVIRSTPEGATVELDGKKLGKTPFDGMVDPAAGTHVLKVRHPGYNTIRKDIELGVDFERDFTLVKLTRKGSASGAGSPGGIDIPE
jgi:eukaryotic-like serine/threonine-protein kinase